MQSPPTPTTLALLPTSLRGRYILTAGLLSTVLLVIAVLGWTYVNQTTSAQVLRIQQRAEAADAINDLETQIRNLDSSLHEAILQPGPVDSNLLARDIRYLRSANRRLMRSQWIASDLVLRDLVRQLKADNDHIELEIESLLDVRRDVSTWFPAVGLMQRSMLPSYKQFSTAVRLAIDEFPHVLDSAEQFEIYKLLISIRHASVRLVSEFRLMVSNRFGIFSSQPTDGMQGRAANIEIYAREVRTLLDELKHLDKEGKLEIEQKESLDKMLENFQQWWDSYFKVQAILESDRWRLDIPILQDSIIPLINRFRQRISSIRLELAVGSARDITELTRTTRQLSSFVILLAATGVILLLAGFYIFHQTLLVPISEISKALKEEAHGNDTRPLPSPNAEETRNLVDAFEEMRNQVRSRQTHLDFLAHHDPLTKLPNRVLFRDRLQHAVDLAVRMNSSVSLLFLDLDRFKQINDTLGHNTGDQLLQIVAERLTHSVRHVDTVARLGGDEFAIIVEDISDSVQISIVAQKILQSFEPPMTIGARQLHVTTSIGIATCPDDGTEVDTLIKNADTAMYHSKERSPNGFTHYSEEMSIRITEFMAKELALREAIQQQQFELYYQPIIDVQTGDISGCEALLRWRHPEEGILLPDTFIEVLEETGLITPVTDWVINQALEDLGRFRESVNSRFTLSLNIAARLLEEQSIVDVLKPALQRNQIDPQQLILEITEDALMKRDSYAENALSTLKEIGVQIAIDDFGKGQSSLNRLRRLPIDIVKIDRDFISDVPMDAYDSELVTAIIAMAHSLRKRVIAEGVENKAQNDFLRMNQCDAVQGYLFSKPVPVTTLIEVLSEGRRLCS